MDKTKVLKSTILKELIIPYGVIKLIGPIRVHIFILFRPSEITERLVIRATNHLHYFLYK
ncbi:hypothetical protein CHUAL_007069 [Chamberlinius hualienensis]